MLLPIFDHFNFKFYKNFFLIHSQNFNLKWRVSRPLERRIGLTAYENKYYPSELACDTSVHC